MNLFHKHKFESTPKGWSYVKCSECGKIVHDPELAHKLWAEFFTKRYAENGLLTPYIKEQMKEKGVIV